MRRRVVAIDTSIFVELLGVPFEDDDQDRIVAEFEAMRADGVEFVLPLATLAETGTHIAHIGDGTERRTVAQRFHRTIEATLEGRSPWTMVPVEWGPDLLKTILVGRGDLPDLIEAISRQYLGMGDLMVLHEALQLADHLSPKVVRIEVWTKDQTLSEMAAAVLH